MTEREVCTVKYRNEVFSTDQASAASEVRYFKRTDRTREAN